MRSRGARSVTVVTAGSTLVLDGERSADAASVANRSQRPASEGFLDFAGFEAARADVGTRRMTAEQYADTLQVRIEAPLRGNHRMATTVAEAGLLPTDGADLGHAAGQCTAAPPFQRDAAARRCENRSAISSALRTASAPFSMRGSACSTRSSVRTPNETGTPVSSAASWRPLAASPAT